VIGSPTAESWADGLKLARDINYQFPQVSSLNLNLLLNGVSEASFALVEGFSFHQVAAHSPRTLSQ